MNYFEALKVKALRSVLKPDSDYYLRKIMRWYSKTFHTPLYDVMDLPIDFLLREFYEERFENMEEAEREEELETMVETEEQRKQRLAAEDYERMSEFHLLEMSKQVNDSALKDKNRKIADVATLKEKPIVNKLPAEISKLTQTLKETAETIKKEMQTDPVDLPPDIDMNFSEEDEEAFARLLESDSNINSNKE